MADQFPSSQQQQQQQQGVADTSDSTVTVVTTETQELQPNVPTVTLRLTKPKTDRKVNWTTDTVDNEHMNKKKSKCCCIYDKPRVFGESSSEESDSDDECDHCHGHVDKKKHKPDEPSPDRLTEDDVSEHSSNIGPPSVEQPSTSE